MAFNPSGVNRVRSAGRRLAQFSAGLLPKKYRTDAPWCGWSVEEENEVGSSRAGVTVRRYPYPYSCAVAISNDTDGMSAEVFHELHSFLNGRKPTLLGDGLGLEVGDSFWVWSDKKHLSLYHNAPYEPDFRLSPESERLVELGRLGWLDTLHGFGEWDKDWVIDRDHVEVALDRLREMGFKSTVYVNHGSVNMAHNIGGPWGYYQRGDLPGERSYCLDLLRQFGFQYYWHDAFYELDKYGEHQVLGSQSDLNAAVAHYDSQRYFRSPDPEDYSRARDAFPVASSEEIRSWKRKLFNRALVPVPVRDGRRLYFFKRFRGHDAPNAGNFILQVNAERLDALEEAQACVVVYQHFGVWRAINMGKKHASHRSSRSPVLDEHAIWAFRELADRQASGRVFVTTTGRLLGYLRVRDHLEYEVLDYGRTKVIQLHAVNCPCYGRIGLSSEMLQGLSFEIPHSWGDVRVEVDGLAVSPTISRTQVPADPNKDVLVLPWKRLEYPE